MTWTAYNILPIDFGWEMLPSFQNIADQLARSAAEEAVVGQAGDALGAFMRDFDAAKQLATEQGWEGDYRTEPRIFWLPDEGEFIYAFVWKQDNNGNTFVVSPRPLDWLASLC